MRPLPRPSCLLPAVALAALTPAVASSQVPAGAEFAVNSHTTNAQSAPAVAREGDGDFVIVWDSLDQDGSLEGIFAQRYDASGSPRGGEFRVNTYTSNEQRLPSVAVGSHGGFIVAWEGAGEGGQPRDVLARMYDGGGVPIGAEFLVNTYTTGNQGSAQVDSGAGGDFVVVWQSEQGIDGTEVMGQRFDRSGRRLGGEFRVNTTTTGNQFDPAVGMRSSNEFVVSWTGSEGGTFLGVFARVFDAQGDPVGAEFRVNVPGTTAVNWRSSVAVADGGRFVVTWKDLPPGAPPRVLARPFEAAGAPLGEPFQVSVTSALGLSRPIVSVDGAGNFVVTWPAGLDASDLDVFARRYSADATPRSAEYLVNTYTPRNQDVPHANSDPSGNVVVAWRSDGQDGSAAGVFGQRFGGLHPRALDVDTGPGPTQDGNGVLEPGEDVNVVPRWQNANGAAQTFAGTIAGVTGPPGCVQALLDGAGNYGTVANGATAPCADCYRVLAFSSGRCQQHWDIRAVETLTPDSQGQVKDWALHVGESFTDVPDTTLFYRFVETLVHHGVTAGCTATEYCRANVTRREEMAVFVMVAKEGTGYRPAACTTPIFNDVPATSPFCPFIEELFRRGAVYGCGGGSYCPLEPVTRGQMSVFALRTMDTTFVPPPCAPPNMFEDVPELHPFCPWIEELVRRGVVTGCSTSPPLYCPEASITRDQMGVFISATFGLLLYGP